MVTTVYEKEIGTGDILLEGGEVTLQWTSIPSRGVETGMSSGRGGLLGPSATLSLSVLLCGQSRRSLQGVFKPKKKTGG